MLFFTNYPSTDTPQPVPVMATLTDTINVPDNQILQFMTIDVNITAPDEGFGPDPTLLEVDLNEAVNNIDILLADGGSASLAPANFENTLAALQPLSYFYGINVAGTIWQLNISNFSSIASAELNSWGLNLYYSLPPPPPNPFPQVPFVLPTAKYGIGGNVKNNEKFYFSASTITTGSIVQSIKLIPYNSYLVDLIISAVSTGSGDAIQISLHQVTNGVDTILLNKTITLSSNLSFSLGKFQADFPLNANDLIYFSIDDAGTNVSKLDIQTSIVSR